MWSFSLPVQIEFGSGILKNVEKYIDLIGGKRGVLVCTPGFVKRGTAQKVIDLSRGKIKGVYGDVRPNPTTGNVNECVKTIRLAGADFAVALGGGSAMDCCKAACAIARGDAPVEMYFEEGRELEKEESIPWIAFPATSGTASEITNISVLSDEKLKIKKPFNSPVMYSKIAAVDPNLTLSVPPQVTASTGLDVLCHAVEAFWSVKHQSICDACALQSARAVFKYLPLAYEDGQNIKWREKMAEASVLAGIAFSHPRTTACHACSFPITNLYGVPHGEACAFTLDSFIIFNYSRANPEIKNRILSFCAECGFQTPFDMAERVREMKKKMKMKTRLSDFGCVSDEQINTLVRESMGELMKNNPVPVTEDELTDIYKKLK